MRTTAIIALTIVSLFFVLPYVDMSDELMSVKQGKTKLYCHLADGIQHVNKDKVLNKKGPYWIFNNGSASNCWTQQ